MQFQILVDTPYLSVKEYARRTGQTRGAVAQQARAGKLPVKPRNSDQEKIFINNALLLRQALNQKF